MNHSPHRTRAYGLMPDQDIACHHMDTSDHPLPSSETASDLSDSPYLSIERLMGQLIDRASEIITSQERVRTLLSANRSIVGELSLPVVLRRVVEAARAVAGAKYAALAVIGQDGSLEQFVHAGMDAATVAAIGQLPKNRGVLGALIKNQTPIRLRIIADDPRSSGFPKGHPSMTSFLGVSVRSHASVFGNLYLTDRLDGVPFTAEDEELVGALAATAGIAIENARLYDESRRRQEWLRASGKISRHLMSASGDELAVLERLADSVKRLASADIVMLVLPCADDPGRLEVTVAAGADKDDLLGFRFPTEDSAAWLVMEAGHGVMIDYGEDAGLRYVDFGGFVPVGPIMAVPLTGAGETRGAIVVGRLTPQASFTQADLEMAEAFAEQAALALELTDARATRERLAALENRDRIARDLHDHVIQRLFAAGLTAQSLAETTSEPLIRDGLARTIGDLNGTIRQIRTTIFGLTDSPSVATSLRRTVASIVEQMTSSLGFRPEVALSGPLDTVADDAMVGDVEAVLRESLTNVSRHSQATTVEVRVAAEASALTITITDDGVGMGDISRRSGLANLRRRAEARGGCLSVESGDEEGLRLQWSIPIG